MEPMMYYSEIACSYRMREDLRLWHTAYEDSYIGYVSQHDMTHGFAAHLARISAQAVLRRYRRTGQYDLASAIMDAADNIWHTSEYNFSYSPVCERRRYR